MLNRAWVHVVGGKYLIPEAEAPFGNYIEVRVTRHVCQVETVPFVPNTSPTIVVDLIVAIQSKKEPWQELKNCMNIAIGFSGNFGGSFRNSCFSGFFPVNQGKKTIWRGVCCSHLLWI